MFVKIPNYYLFLSFSFHNRYKITLSQSIIDNFKEVQCAVSFYCLFLVFWDSYFTNQARFWKQVLESQSFCMELCALKMALETLALSLKEC